MEHDGPLPPEQRTIRRPSKRPVTTMDEIRRADHVAWNRIGGVYEHHGIVAEVNANESSLTVYEYTSDRNGKTGSLLGKGVVRESRVPVALSRRDLFRFEYQPGETLPDDEVIQKARSVLGQREYNPLTNNCEHYARWCKTGQTESDQAAAAIDTVVRLVTVECPKYGTMAAGFATKYLSSTAHIDKVASEFIEKLAAQPLDHVDGLASAIKTTTEKVVQAMSVSNSTTCGDVFKEHMSKVTQTVFDEVCSSCKAATSSVDAQALNSAKDIIKQCGKEQWWKTKLTTGVKGAFLVVGLVVEIVRLRRLLTRLSQQLSSGKLNEEEYGRQWRKTIGESVGAMIGCLIAMCIPLPVLPSLVAGVVLDQVLRVVGHQLGHAV